jgi:hypothetical protein
VTTFTDGPAHGQALSLRRSPIFLRVVTDGLRWDALDQLGDTPKKNEVITAYEIAEHRGTVHINRGRHGSGWFAMATYKLLDGPQPPDEVLRDTTRWRDWCRGEVERRKMPNVIDPTKETP